MHMLALLAFALVQLEQLQPPPTPQPQQPSPATEDSTVGTPEEQIELTTTVSDERLGQTVQSLLERYPGVVSVQVTAADGVVELEGHLRTEDTRERVTQFVRRVEGVRLVLNRMQTDEQVLSSWDLLAQRLAEYGAVLNRYGLRALGAVVIFFLFLLLSRALAWLLALTLPHIVERELLRSIIQSAATVVVVTAGLLVGLSFTGLSELVLSIAGIAGIVGITLGFAFRDIGENFIASVFLGFRRPFTIGDVIEVGGRTGIVRAMNMRATVLLTFEGSHIRIPNGIVFKEVLVNRTSGGKIRTDFSMLVPFTMPVRKVIESFCGAVKEHPLVEPQPEPRVFIEKMSPEGTLIHGFFWHSAEQNPILLKGEILLRLRAEMDKLHITPPPPEFKIYIEAEAVKKIVHKQSQEEKAQSREQQKEEEMPESQLAKEPRPVPLVPAGPENVEEGHNMLTGKKPGY